MVWLRCKNETSDNEQFCDFLDWLIHLNGLLMCEEVAGDDYTDTFRLLGMSSTTWTVNVSV